MRITVMGRQGSGKGTQGARLAQDAAVPHIAIGDLVRQRAQVDDEMGRQIAAQMEAGELVDEAFVIQALADHLATTENGFVLDGFPRQGTQVQSLDAMLERLGVKLDAAVHLAIDADIARQRLADRLVCRTCGRSTNRQVAEAGGPCPAEECDGRVERRADDVDPFVVETRLKEFDELTAPVIDEYRREGRLIEVDAARDPEAVYESLSERVRHLGDAGADGT